ncbi:hypothetical protein BDL97_16G084600 [Sphagnum fallax]|nr:hypothetical protein BDL97_16G084600 [Sphagnum fallax]
MELRSCKPWELIDVSCFGQKTSKQKVYITIQWHFNMFVQDPIVSIAPKTPNSDLQLLLDFCLFFKERLNSKVLSLHGCSEA